MQKILELITRLINDESLLTGTLSNPVEKKNPVARVRIRPVNLKGHLHYQFAYHEAAKVKHRNLSPAESREELAILVTEHYKQALLCFPDADYQIFVSAKGKAKVLTRPPTKKSVSLSHDRRKNYIIPDNHPCPFLTRLGVMNQQGRVLPSRMH
ncbi:MAG: SAM-dependent methyltransferase, partial [Firmicutes bacterium]|nr:SAM-dependent methyltransferase [Bacillota bacterium]